MRTGHHTYLSEGRIDYKELRKINPETARIAVLEYLKTNPNISQAARMFGEEYLRYKKSVPMFIPRFGKRR